MVLNFPKLGESSKWQISCENFSKFYKKCNLKVKLGSAIALYDVTFAEGKMFPRL